MCILSKKPERVLQKSPKLQFPQTLWVPCEPIWVWQGNFSAGATHPMRLGHLLIKWFEFNSIMTDPKGVMRGLVHRTHKSWWVWQNTVRDPWVPRISLLWCGESVVADPWVLAPKDVVRTMGCGTEITSDSFRYDFVCRWYEDRSIATISGIFIGTQFPKKKKKKKKEKKNRKPLYSCSGSDSYTSHVVAASAAPLLTYL